MGLSNPFSIKYGDRTVGGSTGYQLLGPYVLDKSYTSLRIVFDVVITAGSYSSLQSKSESLEDDFSLRLDDGDEIIISMSGSSWTYTMGETLLSATASITKSGNPDTDRGYSRSYTCAIEAELPAEADGGLRDIEVVVDYESTRQKIVTMQGTYTATSSLDAVAQYQASFDTEATTYLTAADSSATWELVDERYSMDRQKNSSDVPKSHTCNFFRQYAQLLANQSSTGMDDSQIRDHRITFTDLSSHPSDAKADIYRLRRVVGSYDCGVDVDQTTDLSSVYESKIKSYVKSEFESEFSPKVFAVEEQRVSYDETSNRISVSMQFLYQVEGGSEIIEVSQSVAFRENRVIDYTPIHSGGELAANADPGWMTLERIWTRTVIALGDATPNKRLQSKAKSTKNAAGAFVDTIGGESGPDNSDTSKVNDTGWNTINNVSQAEKQWIGIPDHGQMEISVLSETVTQRYHEKGGSIGGGAGPITRS